MHHSWGGWRACGCALEGPINRATTYSVDGMIFRQSSAFKIINGKVEWRFKKCRFSVTRTSAPVHSTYAAIKASAGFSPIASYFAPNSKGTTKSSSISVKLLMNSINSMYSSAVKWRRTSSVINRGIRIACFGNVSRIVSRRTSQEAFFEIPKAKIYSFESRTSSKLFIPKFFSCFTDNLNYFFFFHVHKRGFLTGCKLSKFVQVRFCPSYIWLFHAGSPPRSTLYHKGKGRSKKNTCLSIKWPIMRNTIPAENPIHNACKENLSDTRLPTTAVPIMSLITS